MLDMQNVTPVASDFSRRHYSFTFSEVMEKRLMGEFGAHRQLTREVDEIDWVTSTSFSMSEQGFGLTLELVVNLDDGDRYWLDCKVEQIIGEVVDRALAEHTAGVI